VVHTFFSLPQKTYETASISICPVSRQLRPHLFTLNDDVFAIAGFWETAGEISRCCLLTTSANSVLEPIRDRMPVIIRREEWEKWFSPGELADRSFQRIMAPGRGDDLAGGFTCGEQCPV